MKINSLIQKIGAHAPFLGGKRRHAIVPPALGDPLRFPYGPFRFRTRLAKGTEYTVLASPDLRTWSPTSMSVAKEEVVEYVDSEAFKFTCRFYRMQVRQVFSANVIGYASVSLPPGFSMIANPFDTPQTVGETFKGWPQGTTLNRFDTMLFKLVENDFKDGKWSNPHEKLVPGEGAIFFNPTSDYKSASFVGDVIQGSLSVPIPAGFSIRSALVPQPGNLADDLRFPISNGDVIHLFDRERQKYVLHPYQDGRWTAGPPIIGVGEAFWVAKTDPGNWSYNLEIGEAAS
ncbi:MAG TPA: hypothetical protein VNZ64_01520 [Candidatus Acidoferrum sp.]|jgi:hypothetical protein|nr:hypothetical protein [Candidatus Acidoferrum sp.]